jgi:Holliday junction resolvase RusA-like endonuclease
MADRKTATRPAGSLKRWQEAVRLCALASLGDRAADPFMRPVELIVTFYLPRPKKPKFFFPAVKPDLDKLVRAVSDALSGVVYRDDSLVCSLTASKEYGTVRTGARVIVRPYP